MERASSYAAPEAVEASALDDMDFDLAKELGFDLETQDDTLAELQEKFGERVFHYGPYSGTVSDMASSCPAFSTELEQGAAAASAWLESHDEPAPEEEPKDEPENQLNHEPVNELEKSEPKNQEPAEKSAPVEKSTSQEKPGAAIVTHEQLPEPEAVETPRTAGKQEAEVALESAVKQPVIEGEPVEVSMDGAVEKVPEPVSEAPLEAEDSAPKIITTAESKSETPIPSPAVAELEPAPVSREIKFSPEQLPAEVSELAQDVEAPEEVEIYHIPYEDPVPEEEPEKVEQSAAVADHGESAELPAQLEEIAEPEEFYWPVRELHEPEAVDEIENDLAVEEDMPDDLYELAPAELETIETEQLEPIESNEDREAIESDPAEIEEQALQATIMEQVLESEGGEQEPETAEVIEPVPEPIQEVIQMVTELAGEEPEETAEPEPAAIRRQVESVTQKIKVLEQAKNRRRLRRRTAGTTRGTGRHAAAGGLRQCG